MDEILQKEISCFNTVTHLELSGRKLSTFELELLNKCQNLLNLDISKNRFRSLVGICLPNLKVLNFEDNCISDVTFLADLPSLEELYIDGNPLSAADRYIVVDQLPKLSLLDGKHCTDIQKTVQNYANQLNTEGMRIYSSKYKSAVISCSDPDEVTQQRRLFMREVLNKMSSCSNLPPKFQRYKVQSYVENLFRSESSPRKSPTKSMRSPSVKLDKLNSPRSPKSVASPLRSPYRKNIMQTTRASLNYLEKNLSLTPVQNKFLSLRLCDSAEKTLKSPEKVTSSPTKGRKRKLMFDESTITEKISYSPEIFLRCHVPKNDMNDCTTPIWAASFEIDTENENQTTDIVATCGGNIICFINCRTAHVVKRYKCDSNTENLFCLDWTILLCSGVKQKASVLATGGAQGKIYLIHPSQLTCYHIFKAHNSAVNCIKFHHSNKTWLFSAGKDSLIHLWDIGELSLPKYSSSSKKLMTFEGQDEVIQIALSPSYEYLFAATNANLFVWDLNDETSWTKKPSVILIIPEDCKSEGHGVVDGLALIFENYIVFKVSNCGKIGLWDFRSMCPGGHLTKKKQHLIKPDALYLWSDSDKDYSYISTCKSKNLMACGDDAGRLWLYGISRINNKEKNRDEISLPDTVLPWPNLEFQNQAIPVKEKAIINSVSFNWNGEYLVACSDTNLVCIWKRE